MNHHEMMTDRSTKGRQKMLEMIKIEKSQIMIQCTSITKLKYFQLVSSKISRTWLSTTAGFSTIYRILVLSSAPSKSKIPNRRGILYSRFI